MYKVFNDNIPLILHSDLFQFAEIDNYLYLKFDEQDDWSELIETMWKIDGVNGLSIFATNIDKSWMEFQSNFKVVKAAGGIIRNEHDEILVIERNGMYDLPKGHIEENELAKEAALREVKEECGLKDHAIVSSNPKVSYHTYLLQDELILKKTFWFSMSASVNEKLIPQNEEGISNLFWMDQRNIEKNKDRFYSSLLEFLV